MLLQALESQDQFLAGSFLMGLALLTVIGMFLSDVALAFLDPRIRLGALALVFCAQALVGACRRF